MGKKLGFISINILAFFITAVFAGSALTAEAKKTVTGVVTESYQIITDDDVVYDIAENETGDELVENAGSKVRATGKVEYDEDMDTRTIIVDSFTVIEKADPEDQPEEEPEMEFEPDSDMEYEAEPEA